MATFAGHYVEALIDEDGDPQVSRAVNVYTDGTSTLATLWTDRTKTTEAANPSTTSTLGNLELWADPGDYEGAPLVAGVEQTRFPIVVGDDPEEPGAQLSQHVALGDPHPTYATDADLISHESDPDAHPATAISFAADPNLDGANVQEALAALAAISTIPTVDFTKAQTRSTTLARVLCIVDAGAVPATDTVGSPHPGNPKPGDLVITVPAGT